MPAPASEAASSAADQAGSSAASPSTGYSLHASPRVGDDSLLRSIKNAAHQVLGSSWSKRKDVTADSYLYFARALSGRSTPEDAADPTWPSFTGVWPTEFKDRIGKIIQAMQKSQIGKTVEIYKVFEEAVFFVALGPRGAG
eukprot:SAG11_NODE_10719_length_807_cov_0.991561_1_plen_141_part_00